MHGQQEIRELALATFCALEEADLNQVLDQIHDRIFKLDCSILFQTTIREGNGIQCSLNPMIELLLRHITDIAKDENLSTDERNQEIAWAMEVSGL